MSVDAFFTALPDAGPRGLTDVVGTWISTGDLHLNLAFRLDALSGVFSDMLPVAQRVEGVIVVVRLGHSRRDEIERFKNQLEGTGIQPVGVVVLGADTVSAGYYYY